MSIKSSSAFVLSAAATSYMFGQYTTTYWFGEGAHAADPDVMQNFEMLRYTGVWYDTLMSNNLPFFIDTCA